MLSYKITEGSEELEIFHDGSDSVILGIENGLGFSSIKLDQTNLDHLIGILINLKHNHYEK
jgi:hypothetical protein